MVAVVVGVVVWDVEVKDTSFPLHIVLSVEKKCSKSNYNLHVWMNGERKWVIPVGLAFLASPFLSKLYYLLLKNTIGFFKFYF